MQLSAHCRALAVIVGLLLIAPAWSAAAALTPPPSAGLSKARALVRAGQFDAALAILRPLAAGRTVRADVLFQIGLAALGASENPDVPDAKREVLLDEAIAAFRAMLVRRPSLVRVRLELARAFFFKGEDGLAKQHFEQVLASSPPEAVALNVNRFLAAIRARKRWSVRVGMALAPDSNIGAGSDERTIWIQGLPFRRTQEELTTSGVGVSVWAGAEYQHPLDDRWRLRAGGDISRREYPSDAFDRMSVSAHLGPRWLVGRATEASLLASARQSWLSDEAEYRDLGMRIEARHRLNRRTMASLNAARHERRYDENTRLDGPVTDISAGVGWVATPALRVDTAVGWGRERPELERSRHSRRWIKVGATMELSWGFTVGGACTLRRTEYQGNWLPFVRDGSPRRDLVRNLRLDIYNRAVTVGGFSPQVSIVQEQRTTNAQAHDYERTFGELRFVRLF